MDEKRSKITVVKCELCSLDFTPGFEGLRIKGELYEIELTGRCSKCAKVWLEKYSSVCMNCGKLVLPNTQVGVIIGANGVRNVCHVSYGCSPPGGAFYGFWGEGELMSSFEWIEQC